VCLSNADKAITWLFQQQRLDDGVEFVKNAVDVINRLAKFMVFDSIKFGQSVDYIHHIFDKVNTIIQSLLLEKRGGGKSHYLAFPATKAG
jgi:hypothetical protein